MIVSLLMAPQSAGFILSQLRRGVADVLLLSRQLTKVIYQNNEVQILSPAAMKGSCPPGRGGAPVKERSHGTGSCQDHSRCGHVGGGEHQRSPHGKATSRSRHPPKPVSSQTDSAFSSQAPDDFYEGITFEHFEQVPLPPHVSLPPSLPHHRVTLLLSLHLQILKGLEMESRMHIRFLDVDTSTMRCGKSSS